MLESIGEQPNDANDATTTTTTTTSRTARWINPVPQQARSNVQMLFPWWPVRRGTEVIDDSTLQGPAAGDCYLVRMAKRGGEAMLIDPGSPGNLCGSRWSDRQAAECRKAGEEAPTHQDIDPFVVGGVGAKPQTCHHKTRHRIGLDDGSTGSYEAPVIPDSDVPALMGLEALERHRSLIDTYMRKLILVGPGGYRLQLSPGSKVFDLEKANTGHLMLPCSNFRKMDGSMNDAYAFEIDAIPTSSAAVGADAAAGSTHISNSIEIGGSSSSSGAPPATRG